MRMLAVAVIVSQAALFTGCSETEDAQQSSFYITDAPIDNAEVKSVFITIADIRVDGKSVAAFEGKKTIDIKALHNGRTDLIGRANLDARAYQNVELVLDLATDASGNAPGCYVETFNGIRHNLAAGLNATTTTITTAGVEVTEFAQNSFVLDFDLRKAIAASTSAQNESDYSFVNESSLDAAVRIVAKAKAGTLSGEIDNSLSNFDKVVVYAYESGTFNAQSETSGQGGVQFQNAVTSTSTTTSGEFELHFLEAGDYELHFAAYDEQPDGSVTFQGMIQLTGTAALEVGNVSVAASAETTIETTIVGVL